MINKKPIIKIEFFLIATCLLVMIGGLTGCSTNKSISQAERIDQKSSNLAVPKTLANNSSAEYERLGDRYFSRGDLVKAFLNYEKAMQLDSENSRVQYKKGLSLVAGKINEDAIKEFQDVIKRDPSFAQAYEGLGLAYFQMKEFEKCEKYFKKSVELNPKLWKSQNYLGTIYDRQKNYKKAIQKYSAAIALKPDEKILYNNLGVSYYLAGEYTRAVIAFNNALEHNNTDAKTYNNLGLALARLGRYQEALDAFRRGGNEAQAHNNLGCIYLEQGKYGKAIDSFRKAIEVNPAFYTKASDNLQKARRAFRKSRPTPESNGTGG